MHYTIGMLLIGNKAEIMENESPEKGNYMGLIVALKRGEQMMKENPNIQQLNFYKIEQGGQRILSQRMLREGYAIVE